MLKSLTCIAAFLLTALAGKSQGEPETFMKTLYNSFEKRDSALFLSLYFFPDDLFKVFATGTEDENKSINRRPPDPSNVQYRLAITQHVFNRILYQIDSSIVDDTITIFGGMKYEIVKSPDILYPSLRGELFFASGSRYYSLTVNEAVFIFNKWKLTALGDMSVVNDTSMFSEDAIKISAFGSFNNTKVQFKDIKLEVVDVLPPPPPPRPKKVKAAGPKK